jgi:hypothetical protein
MQTDDRIVVLEDEKARILDLTSFKFVPPSEGIYEGTVRYYKANLKWAKIIEGFASWLATVAAWPDAEDENYHAIQQILIFLEGVEPMGTVEDICAGVLCALETVSSRVLAGQAGNIIGGVTINPDGSVTVGGGATLPTDDPSTLINETEAARFGGVNEVAAKIELFLDKLDTAYGATNGTPTMLVADAKNLINGYFQTDITLMNAAIDAYYSYRATNNRILFDRPSSFALYLYCNGYTAQSVKRWFLDTSGFVASKMAIVLQLIDALLPAFFTDYYGTGIAVPSSLYLDAPCVPIEYQEFENVPFASARATTVLKASHRMKFRISGHSVDTDGDIQDAFYYVNASTGVRTRTNPTMVHSAGANMPLDTQIPYNTAHVYEYTIDLGALNGSPMTITMNKHANMSAGASNPNFEIQITDLGLAVSQ